MDEKCQTACLDIVEAGHKLINSKMTVGSWGNISLRVDEHYIAITPSGRSYESLTEQDISLVDLKGIQLAGVGVPSSELPMHLEIYKNVPPAQAIVHTHSIYATALACNRVGIPALVEDMVQIVGGAVACSEYALPGTRELGGNVVKSLDNKKAVLIANHGVVAWGATVDEALLVAEVVEKAANIYCIAKSIGNPCILSDDDVKLMHTFYESHYYKRMIGEE